jgi:hypothetical protein
MLLLTIYGILYLIVRKNTLYMVSSILIGIATFSLIFVLNENDFGVATGLGLFAIFGILRYRTEQVPIIEMTYLFISISMSVVIALSDERNLSFKNAVIIDILLMLSSFILFWINQKKEIKDMEILIDSVDWINLEEAEKISFLNTKSSGKVINYKITNIDWLKETTRVIVYYQ